MNADIDERVEITSVYGVDPISVLSAGAYSLAGVGGIGESLTVSGAEDRSALISHIDFYVDQMIWDHDLPTRLMSEYPGSEPEVCGDVLYWWFSDCGGCCTRSQEAFLHWLRWVFAADWDVITDIASTHGFAIVSERPTQADVLALAGDSHLLNLRNDLWLVGDEGLNGDDEFIPITELNAEERVLHAHALDQCLCGMCRLLKDT